MTHGSGTPIVLIIDHDLGFLMWLGELFAELGFHPVPALNCRQALRRAGDLDLPISAVVMNPKLRGSRPMLAKLAQADPDLRVVLIQDSSDRSTTINMPRHRILQRPTSAPLSRPAWLAKIRGIFANDATGHHA